MDGAIAASEQKRLDKIVEGKFKKPTDFHRHASFVDRMQTASLFVMGL